MRSSMRTATPSRMTPNTALTVFIQTPAFGSNLPPEAPITSSGAPMPLPSANMASAPVR